MNNVHLCADASRAIPEVLAGTATIDRLWFLLEYRQNWQPHAVDVGNNTLDKPVADHIAGALQANSARMTFIRQQNPPHDMLQAFIAFPAVTAPRLYRLTFARYSDLLDLPLGAMLAGEMDEGLRWNEPLYTICTHKERDRSCGAYGWETYLALREAVGEQVWQSTHIGGHRFAGTLIAFPHGTYYGYLDPSDVPALVAAESCGEMLLPKVRGRVGYDSAVQAAEVVLREHIQQSRYDALTWLHTENADGVFTVTFAADGVEYQVRAHEEKSTYTVVKDTGKDAEPVKVWRTHIVE